MNGVHKVEARGFDEILYETKFQKATIFQNF